MKTFKFLLIASLSFVAFASLASAAAADLPIDVVTPAGVQINLTQVTNPTTGVVSFTITSIVQQVTNPETGKTVAVTVTTGPLIGATLTGITSSTASGSQVALSITPWARRRR